MHSGLHQFPSTHIIAQDRLCDHHVLRCCHLDVAVFTLNDVNRNADALDKARIIRAEKTILSTLPEDLQDVYAQVLTHSAEASESEAYLRKLIKAADKIAALIKCIEEAQSGNSEFITAEASTRGVVEDLADSLPEVHDFMTEFLPSYGETLDQLL